MNEPILINDDCLKAMCGLESNSIDAVVTDPPYGLNFMGKDWGHGVPGDSFWKEAMRIAKPGAHLLAFGGTRTYHRLACAIEDAGWEIRDCIMWVYGYGFPKNLDVSKAIDKYLGSKRKSNGGEGEHEGNINFGMKNRCPKCGKPYFSGNPCTCPREDKIPITSEVAKWNGWGTCLKPAYEPIIMARKPLEGTIAENVLKYEIGALNIDACRVPTISEYVSNHSRPAEAAVSKGKYGNSSAQETHQAQGQQLGRFPSNFIHDGSEEVLKCFPNTSKSVGGGMHTKGIGNNQSVNCYGKFNNGTSSESVGFGDCGSAERFFYCAKASKAERGEGNDHTTVKPISLMRYLITLVSRNGAIVLDPFMGSGSTGVATLELGRKFIGIEKDEHYFSIAQSRIGKSHLNNEELDIQIEGHNSQTLFKKHD